MENPLTSGENFENFFPGVPITRKLAAIKDIIKNMKITGGNIFSLFIIHWLLLD